MRFTVQLSEARHQLIIPELPILILVQYIEHLLQLIVLLPRRFPHHLDHGQSLLKLLTRHKPRQILQRALKYTQVWLDVTNRLKQRIL